MHPISDLTAYCRRTTGDVPPKLVGASTTVVGEKMYLYGGRLVSERRMVSDIYMFDLESSHWEKLTQSMEDDIPQARYFHSADAWRNYLIIFGGMAIKPESDNPEDLCVLNDVRLFDLNTRHWLLPSPLPEDPTLIPKARYAHLSSVTSNRLFIIGGQDLANVWLDDTYVYDLATRTWILRRDYLRHCGTYRSVAVTAAQKVRLPQEEFRNAPSSSTLGPPGSRFKVDRADPSSSATKSDALIHLPYSAQSTDDHPCDVYLFSNYNFTDVQRELEVFSPLPDFDFTITDRSASMTGAAFPPGLRFPTGAILGTHFIIAGTYLSQTYQSFHIWALDLVSMSWSRLEAGSALSTGSWFRSCLWESANKFLIFGNRHGNLVEDYNRRLLSWDHVTCIDLEAFGIYQPPRLVLEIPMQELGLAALEEDVLADFEIICDDGRTVKVSRKLLEDRWPWFKEQRKVFLQMANHVLETLPSDPAAVPLPDLPTVADTAEPRPDPRLTPRSFLLSEPYPITLALMQYFYSMALLTPLQHAPAVLSQLLLLSTTYRLPHLQDLVKHAMHRALTYSTSVGIYSVSTLCGLRSLQIRALRVVMAYQNQKRPTGARARPERDGPGSRPPDSNNGGNGGDGSNGGGGGDRGFHAPSAARPRGMSDASYMRGSESSSAGSNRVYVHSGDGQVLHALPSTQKVVTRSRVLSEPHMFMEPTESPQRRLSQPAPNTHLSQPMIDNLLSQPSIELLLAQTSLGSQPNELEPANPMSPVREGKISLHRPSNSMVSIATDEDILALADLIAPAIESVDLSDGHRPILDLRSDLQIENNYVHRRPTSSNYSTSSYAPSSYANSNYAPSSYAASTSAASRSSWSRRPPVSPVSPSFDVDGDSHPDDFCDSALLSPVLTQYPVFHLPRASRRNSDTPSLTSSTSTSSLSSPSMSREPSLQQMFLGSSTNTPITPTSSVSGHSYIPRPLGVIEEGPASADFEQILDTDSEDKESGAVLVRAESFDHTVNHESSISPWLHRSVDHEKLRIETQSPATITPDRRSPQTSVSPASSQSAMNKNSKSIARLFRKDDKGSKTGVQGSQDFGSSYDSLIDITFSKADEKKKKKEEARARTERLAMQFAAKEKARKQSVSQDNKSLRSTSSSERSKAVVPFEDGGLYGGMTLTTTL